VLLIEIMVFNLIHILAFKFGTISKNW